MNVIKVPKSVEEIKTTSTEPSFESMVEVVHGMLGKEVNGVIFTIWPWMEDQIPSLDDVKCIYEERKVMLTGHYLQACLLSGLPIPIKYKDHVERLVDPVGYQKKIDDIEFQVKMAFDVFLSTNPTLKDAVAKLVELAHDHWQEHLDPELAEKQIRGMYPEQQWRGEIIL